MKASMKPSSPLLLAVLGVWSLMVIAPAAVQAQEIKTSFVRLGQGEPGVLYEPVTPGPKSQIAVFAMHSAGDYLTHSSCTQLSKRGYRVLCANNSNSKSGLFNDGNLDKVLLQVKAAIVYLRKYPGVKKVVLWGHSGGATIMTAYQDIAENGVKVCQDAAKIHKCPDSLAGMPAADGVVLGDANWGLAPITVIGMDPAVIDGDSGMKLNPDLDMFNPRNGFKPTGSTYSQNFIHRFQVAEGKRNNALIKLAQQRLAAIETGKGRYSDDEPFIIAGASFTENKLYAQDVRLFSRTEKAWPLLHADGSITTEIVHTVRVPTITENPSDSYMEAALKTTVRNFLNTYAIRVTDDYGYDDISMHGVEWTSSYASNPGNMEGVTVPFLALGMTGSYESASAETIYNHSSSADKTLVYVEGASHGYPTCKRCEKTPGQYGDTMTTLYDYVDGWLSTDGRFF
jgi:hypothetical protein